MKSIVENAPIEAGLENTKAELQEIESELEGDIQYLQAQLEAVRQNRRRIEMQRQVVASRIDTEIVGMNGQMKSPALKGSRENHHGAKRATKLYLRGQQGISDTGKRASMLGRMRIRNLTGKPAGERVMDLIGEVKGEQEEGLIYNNDAATMNTNETVMNGSVTEPSERKIVVPNVQGRPSKGELKQRWPEYEQTEESAD